MKKKEKHHHTYEYGRISLKMRHKRKNLFSLCDLRYKIESRVKAKLSHERRKCKRRFRDNYKQTSLSRLSIDRNARHTNHRSRYRKCFDSTDNSSLTSEGHTAKVVSSAFNSLAQLPKLFDNCSSISDTNTASTSGFDGDTPEKFLNVASDDKFSREERKHVHLDNSPIESRHYMPNTIEVDTMSIVTNQSFLSVYYPAFMGCRHVDEFKFLNKIGEGTFGVVYKAKEKQTGNLVALKWLKLKEEHEFAIREFIMLLKARNHPNIVNAREVVASNNIEKVYLVMDYVEYDLKSLMEKINRNFSICEVKVLMHQLLSGVYHLHDNWILHRDLKTSNLLITNEGVLKIGDFGSAREYSSSLKPYTTPIVTLWYRAPELLLGMKYYSTPIDIWSVGCIFGELLTSKPLFTGRGEIDQCNKIFALLGTPNANIWAGYDDLPVPNRVQFSEYPSRSLRAHFGTLLSRNANKLMTKLLTYDPEKRISAKRALEEDWFKEEPPFLNTIAKLNFIT